MAFISSIVGLLGDPSHQTTKINLLESLPRSQGQLNRPIVLMDCVVVALRTLRKKYRRGAPPRCLVEPQGAGKRKVRWAVVGLLIFYLEYFLEKIEYMQAPNLSLSLLYRHARVCMCGVSVKCVDRVCLVIISSILVCF